MKKLFKILIGSAGTALLLGFSSGAQAQAYPEVSWSINIGSHGPVYAPPAVVHAPQVIYPAPVIVQPRPVYVKPAHVHYQAPVVYQGRPHWAGHRGNGHWKHRDHRGKGHGHHGRSGRDGRGHH